MYIFHIINYFFLSFSVSDSFCDLCSTVKQASIVQDLNNSTLFGIDEVLKMVNLSSNLIQPESDNLTESSDNLTMEVFEAESSISIENITKVEIHKDNGSNVTVSAGNFSLSVTFPRRKSSSDVIGWPRYSCIYNFCSYY